MCHGLWLRPILYIMWIVSLICFDCKKTKWNLVSLLEITDCDFRVGTHHVPSLIYWYIWEQITERDRHKHKQCLSIRHTPTLPYREQTCSLSSKRLYILSSMNRLSKLPLINFFLNRVSLYSINFYFFMSFGKWPWLKTSLIYMSNKVKDVKPHIK